ncbi:hypothetical protein [Terrabacter sp. 2YAF2]|uniref:hypothetical protein n=1 Tax=Terrabacter sp. 2YAF2 TaxID=3233026 RepID=UPI003F983527
MAAARAAPTAGPGAGAVTDELGLLLDMVTDGSGAVVDVDSVLVTAAVETGAATP